MSEGGAGVAGDGGAAWSGVAVGLGVAADESGKVLWLIQIKALLQELKLPIVRADFLARKVMKTEDPEMVLLSLHCINDTLFPAWSPVTKLREDQSAAAVAHIDCLHMRSPESLKLCVKDLTLEEYSYATWANTLNIVMNSSYWKRELRSVNLSSVDKSPSTEGMSTPKNPVGVSVTATPLVTSHKGIIQSTKVKSIQWSIHGGETLKSYCLRVLQEAGMVGSDDLAESLQRVEDKVMASSPQWFSRAVRKRKMIKKMLHLDCKLTWSLIIEEAERQDKLREKSLCHDIGGAVESAKVGGHLAGVMDQVCARSVGPRIITNSKYGKQTTRRKSLTCQYCNHKGHQEDSCWRKLHSCLICGDPSHHFKQCSKYSLDIPQNNVPEAKLRGSTTKGMSVWSPTIGRPTRLPGNPSKIQNYSISVTTNDSDDLFALNHSEASLVELASSNLDSSVPFNSNNGSLVHENTSESDPFACTAKMQPSSTQYYHLCMTDDSNYQQPQETHDLDFRARSVPHVGETHDFDASGAVLGRGIETWEFPSIEVALDLVPFMAGSLQQSNSDGVVDDNDNNIKITSHLEAAVKRIVRQTTGALGDVLSSPGSATFSTALASEVPGSTSEKRLLQGLIHEAKRGCLSVEVAHLPSDFAGGLSGLTSPTVDPELEDACQDPDHSRGGSTGNHLDRFSVLGTSGLPMKQLVNRGGLPGKRLKYKSQGKKLGRTGGEDG